MFNVRNLKRKYPTDDGIIRRLVGNEPYIEFDEPIEVKMKILGDECTRSIGLVTSNGVVYSRRHQGATHCSLGFEILWHDEWRRINNGDILLKWAEELDEEQKNKELETIGEDDMFDI